MAIWILALGVCAARRTAGESQLTERLEHKLEDDYLPWCSLCAGPRRTRPNFILLHLRWDAQNLELKDWWLGPIRRTFSYPNAFGRMALSRRRSLTACAGFFSQKCAKTSEPLLAGGGCE